MPAPLIPQEIYLLERFTSVEYFDAMRKDWRDMVGLCDRCLDVYSRNLAPDHRRRPLYDQIDIVWGERVLANFQRTLEGLDSGFIELTHGDKSALRWAGDVNSDFIGYIRDYSADWMNEPAVAKGYPGAEKEFRRLMDAAYERASNINFTTGAGWIIGALAMRYSEKSRGPLDVPAQWPTYRLNADVRVASDQPVPRSGCYLPDEDNSAPQFLIEGEPAALAQIGRNPKTTQRWSEGPTVWTFIERTSDTGGGIPGETPFRDLPGLALPSLYAQSGEPCPLTGMWSPRADVPLPDAIVQQGSPMPMAEWHDSQGQFQRRAIKWQCVSAMD